MPLTASPVRSFRCTGDRTRQRHRLGGNRVLVTSHSVEWEDSVHVRRHAGPSFPAAIAGHDPVSDLVVLRVENLESPPLPHAGCRAGVQGTWRSSPDVPGTGGRIRGWWHSRV